MTPADIERRKADLCASYQAAVFNALVRKSALALERNFVGRDHRIPPSAKEEAGSAIPPYSEGYRSFGLSGGVANNKTLQAELEKVAKAQNIPFFRAQPQHTGDNAGMIAFAAWAEREAGGVNETGLALEIAPSLPLALGVIPQPPQGQSQ